MDRRLGFVLILLVVLVVLVAHVFAVERQTSGGARLGGARLGGARRGGGGGFTHLLLPAGRGPHTHRAALGPLGDGLSTRDMGHQHAVRDFKAAAGPDGHIHDITQYMVAT